MSPAAARSAALAAGLSVLLSGVSGSGCGWSSGLAAPDGPVGVEWFGNDTPEPGIEIDLSREISRAVADLVDARLVAPRDASVVVTGRIEGFRRRRGVRNQENGLLETGIEVIASAQLIDRAGGDELGSARASVWAGFAVDQPENDRLSRARALRKVADELVLDLFAPVSEASSAASTPEAASALEAVPDPLGGAAAPRD